MRYRYVGGPYAFNVEVGIKHIATIWYHRNPSHELYRLWSVSIMGRKMGNYPNLETAKMIVEQSYFRLMQNREA